MMGWGMIVFVVLAAFVLSSLALTFSLAQNEKFNWISDSAPLKIGILIFGFFFIFFGIVYISSFHLDFHNNSTLNGLGKVIMQYGAFWLPLCFLVPCTFFIFIEDLKSISPLFYKVPLITAVTIGLCLKILNNNQLAAFLLKDKVVSEKKLNSDLMHIKSTDDVGILLYYLYKYDDPRISNEISTKLKLVANLDSALIEELNQYQVNGDYRWVIHFMKNHKVKNPELFVKPMEHAINVIIDNLKFRFNNSSSESEYLSTLQVDDLCNVLSSQFKQFSGELKPLMNSLNDALAIEPLPVYMPVWLKYRAAAEQFLKEY